MAESINALAPPITNSLYGLSITPSGPYGMSKGQDILEKAKKKYAFIAKHDPEIIVNPNGGEGYAETYPIGETGDPMRPRPESLPIDRPGIEIYKPEAFSEHDLAGEMLHIDPYAHETRSKLQASLSPAQWDYLKQNSLDYANYVGKLPEAQNLQNAADSAMRGYVIGQWPEEVNAGMKYTPKQQAILDSLKEYMRTGKRK